MLKQRVLDALDEGLRLRELLKQDCAFIEEIAAEAATCLKKGGKLLFAGNGGSAADSQHLATELVVRLSGDRERAALAGLALSTDSSLLTACSNDYGYNRIFSRQVEALGKPGDILFTLSTSGNSENLVVAAKEARSRGLQVVGLLGGSGGSLKDLCDRFLLVPARNPGRVQEAHITLGHILIDLVEVILYE